MRSNHSFAFSLHSHYKGIEKSFLADAMNMDAGTGSGDWFDEGTFKFQNNNHRHHHRNYILLPFWKPTWYFNKNKKIKLTF